MLASNGAHRVLGLGWTPRRGETPKIRKTKCQRQVVKASKVAVARPGWGEWRVCRVESLVVSE